MEAILDKAFKIFLAKLVQGNLVKCLKTLLLLINGSYQVTEYTGNQLIFSQTFPELKLTAVEVLQAR